MITRKTLDQAKAEKGHLDAEKFGSLSDTDIERLMEEDPDLAPPTEPLMPLYEVPNEIFVVHGHERGIRDSVARFLEKIGLTPIILDEQPNKGRTIISKLMEESAKVKFAIVIMTADDIGRAKNKKRPRSRARQNVIFELGYFVGFLREHRVAALVEGNVERFSDFPGFAYISLDEPDWQTRLGRELRNAGYAIDWNKMHG
jgi:predicted nucleotide-binding protein